MTVLRHCVPIDFAIDGPGEGVKSLLIVYHSQSGASARLARAAWQGAQTEPGIEVSLRRVWDAGISDLREADGLLLVAAENSGSVSGATKDFLDRSFYPAIASGLVMPYALLVSAGNDGRGAVRQVQRILSGVPFPAAAEPVILRGDTVPGHLDTSRELGEAFAAGLQMGIF